MSFLKIPDESIAGKSWFSFFCEESSKGYFRNLDSFLSSLGEDVICPARDNIFKAFELCPLENLKVVIIGQDPYYQAGKADGLCFSYSQSWQRLSSRRDSLDNILLEVKNEGYSVPDGTTSLEKWARRGVLLLNAVLTVDKDGKPGSHFKRGWEIFTDAVICRISEKREPCVFLLWGSRAQEKRKLIDNTIHNCICSTHPCPMSATGFLKSNCFNNANDFLGVNRAVDWSLD